MSQQAEWLRQMFDMEDFRHTGHALIDLLANQLTNDIKGQSNILNWQEPQIADQLWQQPLPEVSNLDSKGLLQWLQHTVIPRNLAVHHPHNFGHQIATPLPLTALCDLVAALTNQAMAIYETGPSATLIERQVIRWLNTAVGWNAGDGVLTSGGAQANLTALLAARQHAADVWQQGLQNARPMRILASKFSHYSVSRAAGIMGLGTDAVIAIEVDANGRMLPDALQAAHEQCIATNQIVMAVVATAGCTPTGSLDPLQAIGEYCQSHSVWLHVDGAHGASALLSNQHKALLKGIELADSLVWDGHKLLYMPATVSAVLFRDKDASYSAFAQDASYLFQGNDAEAESFNISYRTLECTKRMMGLKLWAAFSLYGRQGLAQLIDHAFAQAKKMASKILANPQLELLMLPDTNIICFRYQDLTLSPEHGNRLQSRIRQHIVASGSFHFTQVEINGVIWLRCTLMNPFTSEVDMDELIAMVRHTATSLSETSTSQ
ncbi:aminotransferase class V-fold PLP-dependent enzyme [Methylobacillus gramineus]|uniref:pyridoxal phosphate-dependent decarboxylase family protein n=1 Tax=Methylobacillus gramineus TaxID=755169 RepID=UPI001CFF7FE2|nr:aminotransferase class V-fold PLP-dependent enzyme [Methylobacillus gramineus]MCB5183675.1 aminotransferase class V-fold PLP-dependent enzyme [Methylobacillus gramineus]